MVQECAELLRKAEFTKDDYSKLNELLSRSDLDVNSYFPTQKITHDVEATLLHLAAARGLTDVIKLLLAKSGIKTQAPTRYDNTPLHSAAAVGRLEACRVLLRVSNILAKNKDGETPLDLTKNNLRLSPPIKKNFEETRNFLLIPTFVEACAAGDIALVKKIVESEKNNKDFDINALDEKYNRNGLHVAAHFCREDVVNYLLTQEHKKIDLEKADKRGYTALHLACMHNKVILDDPESISSKDLRNHPKPRWDNEAEVKAYMERKYRVDEQAKRVSIADSLLTAGAKINAKVLESEFTAFYFAALQNQLDLVRLLVIRGVVIDESISDILVERCPEVYKFLTAVEKGKYKPAKDESVAKTCVSYLSRPYRISFLPTPLPAAVSSPSTSRAPAARHEGEKETAPQI